VVDNNATIYTVSLPPDATQSAVMRLYVSRLAVRPSVRLSVTLRYDFYTGWNTSKIISRPNSLRPMRLVTPTWAIWCNTPKFRVEYGWGQEHIKAAVSPKRCKIGLIGSYVCAFDWHQYQWPWMTLNGRNAPLAEINKNSGAHQKNFNAIKCRPVIVVSTNIRCMRICIAYYRAMLRRARLWDCMSSVRLWRWGMIFTRVRIRRK